MFKNLKFGTRVVIFIDLILVVILFLLCVLFYQARKSQVVKDVDIQMAENLDKIENFIQALDISASGHDKYIIQSIQQEFTNIKLSKIIDSIDYSVPFSKVMDEVEVELEKTFNDIFYEELTEILDDINYFHSGFPMLIDKTGKLIYHPSKTGTMVTDKVFFTDMVASGEKEGKLLYRSPENSQGKKMLLYYSYYEPNDVYITATLSQEAIFKNLRQLLNLLIIGVLLVLIAVNIAVIVGIRPFIQKLHLLIEQIRSMALGRSFNQFEYNNRDELYEMIVALGQLSDGLEKTSGFARSIGSGRLDAEFVPLSNEDVLGNALLEMRKNLAQNKEEEIKRKAEDDKRSWRNQGLAKFNDILRKQNNLKDLGEEIAINMAEYLHSEICGIFTLDEKDGEKTLNLLAAFAYDRNKYMQKSLRVGEGLLGASIKEKKTIYLKKVPNDYVAITSGLGKTNPSEILIVPLKNEERIYGAIELASLKAFEEHEVDFVETIGATIASTIATARINEQTNKLLEQSKIQGEELASREEELRQNMEEMAATQEESQRREDELMKQVEQLKKELDLYKNNK